MPVRYYIVVGRGRRFVLFNSSEMIRCSNFQFTRNVIFFIAITIYNEWKELINYDPYLCTLVEGGGCILFNGYNLYQLICNCFLFPGSLNFTNIIFCYLYTALTVIGRRLKRLLG